MNLTGEKIRDKEYRFNHFGGLWYEKRMKDLLINCNEKNNNKDDEYYNIINEYLELDKEYKEFQKWVKKEVKRRNKIAFQDYINSFKF